MGCCFSRPDGPNSPYPGGAGSGSARAINAPPHPAAGIQTAGDESLPSPTSGHSRRHRPHSNRPLAQHINKPLRRHEWTSRNRTWTRAALNRERVEFFDTRVTGREEIWQTIRAAVEVLWDADAARAEDDARSAQGVGRSAETDPAVAVATAQSIFDAADITLPSGDLANGVYDSFGNYYPLPEYIVADPVDLVEGGDDDTMGDTKGDITAGEDSADDGELDTSEVERRREEKGKAVVDVRDQVIVVVRLSETGRDLRLHVGKDETVRSIARRILDETRHRHDYGIRIAYLGKILKDNASLEGQGWKQGQVVNAFMFEHR